MFSAELLQLRSSDGSTNMCMYIHIYTHNFWLPTSKLVKSRDITLPTKVCLVKVMVCPLVMYRCESWTIKKAECQRIDAFELWFWRRLLRVPWTARRSNQLILKEMSSEYSLEGLMLKRKLKYFGHLMGGVGSFEKTLMLGKTEGRRRKGQQKIRCSMASPIWWIWVWASSRSCWWTGRPGVLQSMGWQRVGHNWAAELNWNLYNISTTMKFIQPKAAREKPTILYSWALDHYSSSLKTHAQIRWRGRWEGGSGWGIHVNPWLIHVSVWEKPLQYCKVISLQLIKINGKKTQHMHRGFLRGLVTKPAQSQGRGPRLDPCLGNKIPFPQAAAETQNS